MSLKIIDIALIRSVFDYGCIVYLSTSKTLLKEVVVHLEPLLYQRCK